MNYKSKFMWQSNCCFLFIFLFINTILNAQKTNVNQSPEILFIRACELAEQQKYAAAKEMFQKLLNERPNYSKAIEAEYQIAFASLQLFNPDAESLFENLIANHPYHSKVIHAYYDLGNFYYRNKNFDKAIFYLEKADFRVLKEQEQIEGKFKIGYCYFSKKEFAKALPWFNQIKNIQSTYQASASYYAAYIEFKTSDYEAALSDLKIAEQDPSFASLSKNLQANIFYKQGKYSELSSFASSILKEKKSDEGISEIYVLAAEAYYFQGLYDEALKFYKKYTAELKGKLSNYAQYRMGYSAFKTTDYVTATEQLKPLAIFKDSCAQAAAFLLGSTYVKESNKAFALTAFDKARNLNFDSNISKEASFNYAKLCIDLEKYSDGVTVLKEFLKKYPNDAHENEAQEMLSESLINSNNPSEAMSYIESIKSKTPRIKLAYQKVTFYRGVELFNANKFSEAIEIFEKSISAADDDDIKVVANFWKAEALSVLKDYPNAINGYAFVFQNAVADSDYHLKSRYGIGYAYYNNKQYEKALTHFKAYVNEIKDKKTKPNYQDALLRLADLYYVTKQYDLASKSYNDVIALKSNEIDYAYFQKGLIAGVTGKYQEAIADLDVVITRYPQSLYYDNAIFQKADFQLENSNYESAIQNFSIIINNFPNSGYTPYAYLKRAIANSNINKHSFAVTDYKVILDKYPNHPVAQNAILGIQEAVAASGKTENLESVISKFKDANPQSDALLKIDFENAKMLYNDQKYLQAIEAFNNYTKNYPQNINQQEVSYYLAESYYRIKDFINALGAFNLVAKDLSSPYYNKSLSRLAEIELQNKSFKSSSQFYTQLLNNSKNKKERCIAWLGLMECHFQQLQFDSSLYFINQILTNGNATVDAENKALLYQGKIAQAQGNLDKAIDAYIYTINNAKDESGAEAQYQIASIQYSQKMYKQSLETLYDFNNNFFNYEKWKEKSFLLIADNFIAMKEYFQARATLNSIMEKSQSKESSDAAKAKLVMIEELDKENKVSQEN